MHKDYSIAEARNHLPRIIHDAEMGDSIQLTRRGKPVAILLSMQVYDRLTAKAPKKGFWRAIQGFRASHDLDNLAFTDHELTEMRSRDDVGRDVML